MIFVKAFAMFEELLLRFEPIAAHFRNSKTIQLLADGNVTKDQYRSVLRQIFHHTRENPQLQALATVKFRGRQRDLVRSFLSHASSEIGHDQLALNDFVTLGGNADVVPYENPLPATSALLSYGFYQIYNLNHLGYLGYLFFLEFNGTKNGPAFINALNNIGIPDNALTFLKDHTEIDVAHNRLMQQYIAKVVRDEADLDCITYAMMTTGRLYEQMLDSAVEQISSPVDVGWNWEELNADRVEPADLLPGLNQISAE